MCTCPTAISHTIATCRRLCLCACSAAVGHTIAAHWGLGLCASIRWRRLSLCACAAAFRHAIATCRGLSHCACPPAVGRATAAHWEFGLCASIHWRRLSHCPSVTTACWRLGRGSRGAAIWDLSVCDCLATTGATTPSGCCCRLATFTCARPVAAVASEAVSRPSFGECERAKA